MRIRWLVALIIAAFLAASLMKAGALGMFGAAQ